MKKEDRYQKGRRRRPEAKEKLSEFCHFKWGRYVYTYNVCTHIKKSNYICREMAKTQWKRT